MVRQGKKENLRDADWGEIIHMHSRVIHDYDKTDDATVWRTIIRHLPILKE